MNQLLIKFLNKFKLLSYVNINGNINLNNRKFKIPILQKVGYSNLFFAKSGLFKLIYV